MTISDRTRKLLWGQSGNRCAHCYRVLTVDETELDDPSVVGEECHIVSGRENGPRYDPAFPVEELDDYGNLLLLCRIDHKTIDDQQRTFDVATLLRMKSDHERKVARALELAPKLLEADDASDPEKLLAGYAREFRVFHESNLPELVATPALLSDRRTTAAELLDGARPMGHLVLTGVSGSGKSHLLRHMALRTFGDGAIPIYARATGYTGSLEQLLDRAVAPFRNASYDVVRAAAARGRKQLVVIIDALNDCPPALREQLRESIAALARRAGHTMWLSSTDDPHLTDVLSASVVRFLPLTDADRMSIFAAYAPSVTPDRSVLGAFATPFEVAVAAETVRQSDGPISAFELLQRFTAKRLSAAERPIHARALLENLSREMSDTFRATVSQRAFARLAAEMRSTDPLGDAAALFVSGLIRSDGNDVSFLHEQIQLYFECLGFLSSHASSSLREIASPRNRRLARLVIAAFDDPEEIRECAVALHEPSILRDMLDGSFGKHARAVAFREASILLTKAIAATESARVTLHYDRRRYSTLPAAAVFEGLAPMDEYELALLQAIGESARNGEFLPEIVMLLERTERAVYAVTPEDDRRSVFAGLYVLRGDHSLSPASVVMLSATTGWFSTSADVLRILQLIEPLSDAPDAVLYLACSLLQHSEVPAPDALRLFREAWSRQRYHLSIEALELIQSRRSIASDDEADEIRNALAECPTDDLMLNTAVTDAMLVYDMIESPVSRERAAEEFAVVASLPDSDDAFELAYGLISNCFEEVFQGAYLDAMHDLTPEQELVVLTRAALGADPSGFHASWILHRLLKIGDERALPAYRRWATLDPANSSFPQSSTETLFLSVGACALLRDPFTTFAPLTRNHEAWQTLAEVVYWMNSPGAKDSIGDVWNRLITAYACNVVEPLIDLSREFTMAEWRSTVDANVWKRFPEECRQLLEAVVRSGMAVTSIHQWGETRLANDAPAFVFGQLATVGTGETLALLRPLVSHAEWGVQVVAAIRAIEHR